MSLDNKQWFFDAASAEERDEWVAAIEQQILSSLQVILLFFFSLSLKVLMTKALQLWTFRP